MRIRPYFALLLFLPGFAAFGQHAKFEFFTKTNGLSADRVWSVAQDQNGFLWVTTDALNRYDGHQFLNYNNHDAPILGRLGRIVRLQAMEGRLFFLGDNALTGFDPVDGAIRRYSLDTFTKAQLTVNQGLLFSPADTSLLFPMFGAEDGRVTLVRFHGDRLYRLATVGDILINTLDISIELAVGGNGYLYYINTGAKAVVMMNAAGQITRSFDLPVQGGFPRIKPGATPDRPIHVITENAVFSLDTKAEAMVPHAANDRLPDIFTYIRDLSETPTGDLWISGSDRYLAFYNAATNQYTDFSQEIRERIPYRVDLGDIFTDNGGVLWIHSISGLLKVSPQRVLFDTYFTAKTEACGGNCSFRGLAEDSMGNIYASFYNNIFTIRSNGHTAGSPLLPLDHTPFDLCVDRDQLILNNGTVFDLRSRRAGNPYQSTGESFDIGILCKEPDGGVWWAYRENVYRQPQGSNPAWELKLSLPERELITDMKYDTGQQALWLSIWHALVRFDPATGEARYYDKDALGENPAIHYVHPAANGNVWLGTEQGLVCFSTETGTVKRYSTAQGLPHNFVVGILPEGDTCLWLSTHFGLSRFRIADATCTNFFKDDGLADNEFNRRSLLMARSGKYYFGGIRGLTVFDPVRVMQFERERKSGGRISMTTWSRTDSRTGETKTFLFHALNEPVDLRHTHRSLSVEVALTDFGGDGKAQYSFQLEGFDDIWSAPSPSNRITFNALPPGEYLLHVKALGSNGRWHPGTLEIPIHVHPPWWKTTAAFLMYGLAFLALGFGILQFFKKRWQLQHALQMQQQEAIRLQEMDAFKSRVYTNLTHEFRTPLTVILGMARELVDSPATRVEAAARLIEKNGKNLLRTINQLLDLSKMESRALSLHYTQGDIVTFIRYVMDSFHSFNESLQLALRFDTNADELVMDFDPEQLQQVLSNLLSNALKFTPPGGEVAVELAREEDQVVISVRDTGIGITPDDLPHIFERFYQADLPAVRAGHGTGIGLAHTHELIRLMDGTINVTSTPGEGSCFTFRLPIRHTAPLQSGPYAPDNTGPGTGTLDIPDLQMHASATSGGGQTILVIEDNPDVVQYLRSFLGTTYQLLIAYSGQAGIDLAFENIPDLVISDVMMPGKDGFVVCDELKNDMRTSHIPIILLTGRADTASRITGLRRGADVFLAKPFNKEELLVRIEVLLERQRRMADWFVKKLQGANPTPEPDCEEAIRVEDAFIRKVREIVAARYMDEQFALPDLCREIGMSRSQLFRKMTALVNTSPSEFIRNFRLEQAAELLRTTDLTVSQVAWQVGFKDPSHFSKVFQETFGFPPKEARM